MLIAPVLSVVVFAIIFDQVDAGCNTSKSTGIIFKSSTNRSKGLPSNVVPDNRRPDTKISPYEESIIPAAKDLDHSKRITNGPELSYWAQSSRYPISRLSKLSQKALSNMDVLPSDPIKAEVDWRYGMGTSKGLSAQRQKQWKARREDVMRWTREEYLQGSSPEGGKIYGSYSGPGKLPKHEREAYRSSSEEW